MPRKSKNTDVKSTIDKKKGLMNTIVKDVVLVENEDIILQLPISDSDINKINITDELLEAPTPYEPNCCYINETNFYNNIQDNLIKQDSNKDNNIEYSDNTIKSSNN